jgi:polysaccharide deacetylase family protein (PEP-CTERM system associated)
MLDRFAAVAKAPRLTLRAIRGYGARMEDRPREEPPRPNVFSVDLEDWYQGLEIDMTEWGGFAPRLERGLDPLLGLLEEARVHATFFILGWQAERTPDVVRRVAAAGHEIASHGWSHRFVYRLSPAAFRDEIRRSRDLLASLAGRPVIGYRAPYFSITASSLWALDVLVEEGFRYDSSIFPTFNYRYGIPGAGRMPGWITTPAGARIYEIPLSTVRAPGAGVNVPVGGGGYFRLYPYAITRCLARHLTTRERQPLVFYVHPWEYDPDHPQVPMPRRMPRLTHYLNLASTHPKTRRLLRDFRFTTMDAAFRSAFESAA